MNGPDRTRPARAANRLPDPGATPGGRGPAEAILIVLVLVLVGSWLLLGWLATRNDGPSSEHLNPAAMPPGNTPAKSGWHRGTTGPWGTLEWLDIRLEPPLSYMTADLCDTNPEPWVFPGFTQDRLMDLFRSAALSPEQIQSFAETTRCAHDPATCVITPQPGNVRALEPESRRRIYSVLSRYPDNPSYLYGFRRKTAEMDGWFLVTDLKPSTQASLKSLLWSQANVTVFSDLSALCLGLGDEEKVRTVKALCRAPALLVKLRVEPGANVEALAAYWGKGARTRDIKPILASLASRAESTTLDVLHLLPVFARTRLNTYPKPTDPKWDCHHSSMNFLSAVPDETFLEGAVVKAAIEADTYEVPLSEVRFGDIVLFVTKDRTVMHSVAYLADGIVFTKNGKSFRKPWILMTLEEVRDLYNLDEGGGIQIRRFKESP